MAALSSHVPDPRLMTAMAEHGDGLLHRVNPWTKVAILGALVLAVTIIDGVALLVGLYAAVFVAYLTAGLPVRRLLGWYSLPVLFVVSIGGPLLVMEPGTPIGPVLATPLGGLSVTIEGARLVVELAARSMAVVTFVLATTMTTPYADVATVVDRLLPRPVDQVALLTYRFTFVMLETLEDLVDAARSRGATLSAFWSNRRVYARMLGMTMITAIERSERLVAAMEARGYDGSIAMTSEIPRPPLAELVVVAATYLLVGGYAVATGAFL
ncbi:cobalt ECF transporter T component CbiQ [Halococcoides cellulosivorans]|uniref:Cobalt ECF transporter T component CbiQ n=1 Tax=Halococcoides cellulosivorans TaxID=1679096 RepID=A0A2R4WXP1_9EURY|nr:cobalt ECF transporter T component CbiQ [Halococcoides cellulosivorans]AWB26281.1 cobalt ECF transporter T component CbiQ [Halococcoides cellulosivorans]